MNEKKFKIRTMCIQVVTQMFAKLCKNNHHTNFQRVEKRFTFYKPATKLFLFQCLYVTNIPTTRIFPTVYSWLDLLGRTNIPGYSLAYNYSWKSWAYNYSWIFLDLPGRTIIPGSRENHQILVLRVYFYIFDAVYGINSAQ